MDMTDDDEYRFCWHCTKNPTDVDEFAINVLAADELIKNLMPVEVLDVSGSLQEGELAFNFPEVIVQIAINLTQCFPVQCRIDNKELSRKVVDEMRVSIRAYLVNEKYTQQGMELLDISLAVLRVVEEVTSYLLAHRLKNPDPDARDLNGRYINVDNQLFQEEYMDIPEWLHDSPAHILGVSVKQICEKVAPRDSHLQVLHCEKIMRTDLRTNFYQSQEQLRESLSQQSLNHLCQVVPPEFRRNHGKGAKEEMIDYLVKPKLTFHGTRSSAISSIVRHGFLKPGDKHPKTGEEVGVRCGNTYGKGIYSSPDPNFAMCYSEFDAHRTRSEEIPGFKLIVCATLMGRAATVFREDNWREQNKPYRGADSHVGNEGQEYIVFSSAQILPCYVIHLDWGDSPTRTLQQIQYRANNRAKAAKNPWMAAALAPGDAKRLKEERLAQARKFFAYGFGPVEGNRIVIEDIADTSDDEEEYGEYYGQRAGVDFFDGTGQEQSIWDWKPSRSRKDQYGRARRGDPELEEEDEDLGD
jgi:Poly(ADP-ribose) polymerase catalytic domain